jgi:hypothetical protein
LRGSRGSSPDTGVSRGIVSAFQAGGMIRSVEAHDRALGDIQERRSVGFTFAWYRLRFTMPETVKGQAVAGHRVFFECNVDNYGEVWVDGVIDRAIGRSPAITRRNGCPCTRRPCLGHSM